jgi:hypothetical protein
MGNGMRLPALNLPGAPSPDELNKILTDAFANAVNVRPPAFLEMPADGVPFNEVDYVLLPAIGATAVVISFRVPPGLNGSIKWLGNNFVGAGFTDGSGSIIWQITADGEPVRNHQHIIGSLGSPASPSETAPIRVYETQTVELTVNNVSIPVAGQLCGGRLSGWYYHIQDDGPDTWG